MKDRGRFVVFEGPDGAGKTTIAAIAAEQLSRAGQTVTRAAFPGHETGTLGNHVYQLHHHPQLFGIRVVAPASLQLLHVAAHVDAIERTIRPDLYRGNTVVLDRFWWSTWVYGREAGVAPTTLDAMLTCEKAEWGSVIPDVVILVSRRDSLRDRDRGDLWKSRVKLYEELVTTEATTVPVRILPNDNEIDVTGRQLESIFRELGIIATSRQQS